MEFTGAFDNMPVGVIAVRRNLEKKDGFEEIYFNKALKNKKCLFENSDKRILFNIFRDRYDEIKKIITDIFNGVEKTKEIYFYSEALDGYFATEVYQAGDKDYCICILREETELVSSRNILYAIKNIFYVISLCNMKEDSIYIFSQRRGDEHHVCQKVNYTNYITEIIGSIVSKEYVDNIIKFMDKDNIRNILTEEKGMVSFEYKRYIHSEEKILWSRMSFIWLNADETGKVKECAMTVKDIHEEKIKELMENKSIRCAYEVSKVANEAKNAFLNNMGQHMKAPVNYISGIVDMLGNSKKYYSDNEKYIKKIRIATAELLNDINKISDMSKIEAGELSLLFERVSIRDTINEIVDEVGDYVAKKNHRLNVDMEAVVHNYIFVDKMRLKQAVKNILLNAIQYTDYNGKIDISVVESEQKFGDLFIYRIVIEDNGPGIESKDIENNLKSLALEVGKNDRKQGIGLGLWLSKNIIRVLNGELKIESELGIGTKCTIIIPVSTDKNYFKEEIQTISDDALSEIGQKSKKDIKRILLVQNLVTARNTMRQKLTCLGFFVEIASTSKEAFYLYKEKGEEYYYALVTDAQLPGINGYNLASEIRKIEKEKGTYLPIIVMSKSENFEDNIYSKSMGVTLHINKGADISVLKAAFDKINV